MDHLQQLLYGATKMSSKNLHQTENSRYTTFFSTAQPVMLSVGRGGFLLGQMGRIAGWDFILAMVQWDIVV